MSDTDREPELAGHVARRVEHIIQQRRKATQELQRLWTAGEIGASDLPCHDYCDGDIAVEHDGVMVKGYCPQYMVEHVCPLTMKEERELRQRLRMAGFGLRYHDPDPTLIRGIAAIDDWLIHKAENVQQGRGVILAGDVGTGKTMTLAYMARDLLSDGYGTWKIHMPRLLDRMMDRTERRWHVERLMSVQVLMIDDLGSGEIQPWILGILEGAIEHRYANKKPVIVTTNMPVEMLKAKPEFRRMVDRWRETNRLVKVGGESQRHAG